MGSTWPGDRLNIRKDLESRIQPGLIARYVSSFSPEEKGHIYQRVVTSGFVEDADMSAGHLACQWIYGSPS